MKIVLAKVGPFKSFDQPVEVSVESAVTAVVGVNEAGKTAFLQAIHKARSLTEKFDPVHDYPRKRLTAYEVKHATSPETVVVLTFALDSDEPTELQLKHGVSVGEDFKFTVSWKYDNKPLIGLSLDERPIVQKLLTAGTGLSAEALTACRVAGTIRAVAAALQELESRSVEDEALLAQLTERIDAAGDWSSVLEHEVWTEFLSPRLPKTLYFDDYQLLPGKVNIADLKAKISQEPQTPGTLTGEYRSAQSLLRMAGVSIDSLLDGQGYEPAKARLEALGNQITDQIFEFWRQNENNLDVEFDVRSDPKDLAPFNNGPNLYIRIKNQRHRVTVPFGQRSKGFIWFFSFLVWFDSVQDTVKAGRPLVLLLDEPGLNLHALAQADFLRYIEKLGEKHQVLYTTHSPFMIRSDRLDRIRVVEDKADTGSVISANLTSSDPRTLLPLQAALGYTIAQNLFISRRNVLVEGPAVSGDT